MEEILLALVCQEFDIEEGLLLSRARHDYIQNAISMYSYIAVTRYQKTVVEAHAFLKSKGYSKNRETLYGQLRRAEHNIKHIYGYREIYSSLIEGVEIALVQGMIIPTESDIHALKGRVVSKMMTLGDFANLTKLEKVVDTYIKAEFIDTRQYEKNPKKETWLT